MKRNETADAILIVLKTVGKWFLIATVILFALFSIIYAFVKIDDYVKSKPKIVDEFLKIKLDEKLSDVLFKIEGFKLDEEPVKGKKEFEIRYSIKDSGISIDVESGRVKTIIYKCSDAGDYMVVNNIFCNDLGEKVLEKYDAVRILCNKEHINMRVYDAVNYGVRYYLLSNKISAFFVSKPSFLETLVGINWHQCE